MDFDSLWNILLVVFGIGLVIFVHELGHFIAARYCGVRVETFSLGFGPRIFGWTRGDTTYQVAIVPLGGYVKMAGEEPDGEPRPPKPDELGAKSVGQRFLIFSGGVIMNVVFAFVVFPVLLLVGVPFGEPSIGRVLPGSGAWEAEIEPGTRVLAVDGTKMHTFQQLGLAVALAGDDQVELTLLPPGAEEPTTKVVEAHYDEDLGARQLAPRPAFQRSEDGGYVLRVPDEGPATAAGLEDGDVLVDIESDVPELDLLARMGRLQERRAPLRITVLRDGKPIEATIEPKLVERTDQRLFGLTPAAREVAGVRGTERTRASGLQVGDVILSIAGTRFDGGSLLDALLAAVGGPLTLEVRRGDETLSLEGPALDRAGAVALAEDVALAPEENLTRIAVTPGSAAEQAGMRTGDVLLSIAGAEVESYEDVIAASRAAAEEERTVAIEVRRQAGDGPAEMVSFDVAPLLLEVPDYGFGFRQSTYVLRETNPIRAMQLGVAFSWSFLEDAWLTVRRIFTRDVSGDAVGGIITIGVVAHSFADAGLVKLFYFLCMLSMNLAFLNVLPIPLLDGGHLFFLLIEKVKGSPVSERVMGYSQLVGLILILSLFVYVTHNDIQRVFFR